MGTRGPKPIYRKPKPVVEAKQVRAPRWLSEEAKKHWRPLARKLAELRLLSKDTAMYWGLFAEGWADYMNLVKRLAKLTGGKNGDQLLFGKGGEQPANTLQLQRLIRLKANSARISC